MAPPLTVDEVLFLGMFNLGVVSYLLRCLQSVSEQSNTTFLADWGVSRQHDLRYEFLLHTSNYTYSLDAWPLQIRQYLPAR